MSDDTKKILEALSSPFTAEEVDWRVGSTAFGRARGIMAGHSVMCASFGMSATCPIATGERAPATPLAVALMVAGEALERGRVRR